LTLRPLIALIRYQLEPDFAVGQVVRQLDPLTLATTVTLALVASLALIAELVEVPVRMFTPEQAGTIVVEAATTGAGTAASVEPRTSMSAAADQRVSRTRRAVAAGGIGAWMCIVPRVSREPRARAMAHINHPPP
jgi:hypothetical protein